MSLFKISKKIDEKKTNQILKIERYSIILNTILLSIYFYIKINEQTKILIKK